MTITAKFSSVCPICNQKINKGDKVEWKKGEKAKHVACVKNNPNNPCNYAIKLLNNDKSKWLTRKQTDELIEIIPNVFHIIGKYGVYSFEDDNYKFYLKISPVNNCGSLTLLQDKKQILEECRIKENRLKTIRDIRNTIINMTDQEVINYLVENIEEIDLEYASRERHVKYFNRQVAFNNMIEIKGIILTDKEKSDFWIYNPA